MARVKKKRKPDQKQRGPGKVSEYMIANLLGSVSQLGVIVPLVGMVVTHHTEALRPEMFFYLSTTKKTLDLVTIRRRQRKR